MRPKRDEQALGRIKRTWFGIAVAFVVACVLECVHWQVINQMPAGLSAARLAVLRGIVASGRGDTAAVTRWLAIEKIWSSNMPVGDQATHAFLLVSAPSPIGTNKSDADRWCDLAAIAAAANAPARGENYEADRSMFVLQAILTIRTNAPYLSSKDAEAIARRLESMASRQPAGDQSYRVFEAQGELHMARMFSNPEWRRQFALPVDRAVGVTDQVDGGDSFIHNTDWLPFKRVILYCYSDSTYLSDYERIWDRGKAPYYTLPQVPMADDVADSIYRWPDPIAPRIRDILQSVAGQLAVHAYKLDHHHSPHSSSDPVPQYLDWVPDHPW